MSDPEPYPDWEPYGVNKDGYYNRNNVIHRLHTYLGIWILMMDTLLREGVKYVNPDDGIIEGETDFGNTDGTFQYVMEIRFGPEIDIGFINVVNQGQSAEPPGCKIINFPVWNIPRFDPYTNENPMYYNWGSRHWEFSLDIQINTQNIDELAWIERLFNCRSIETVKTGLSADGKYRNADMRSIWGFKSEGNLTNDYWLTEMLTAQESMWKADNYII